MAGKSLTKSEFVNAIAEKTGLTKKQVGTVLDAMNDVVSSQLKRDVGVTIPGLIKLNVNVKEATAARPGINPFTKEPTVFKAKPARRVVKARPMKALKDAV